MKEIYEFRINNKFASMLFNKNEGKQLQFGNVVVIQITKNDPRFSKIGELQNEFNGKDKLFYTSWNIIRIYSKSELDSALLLQIIPKKYYSSIIPEEMGTIYDEKTACKICGVGTTQIGPLKISKNKAPKKDLAILLGNEAIVSEKFVDKYINYKLKGVEFKQVYSGKNTINYYQLLSNSPFINVSDKTTTGIHPFDFSENDSDGTPYKCPKGHKIGLNILSELYVKEILKIEEFDFYITREHVGVTRKNHENEGFLRAHPMYLCSQKFREMVEKEKLSGFGFEVVYIVKK
jgi:hypothetical protein